MGLRVVALLDIHRMRSGIVIQAADVPKLEGEINRGLAIHGKECAGRR